jgi:hypothetical protein
MKRTVSRKTTFSLFALLLGCSVVLTASRSEAADQTNERPIYFGVVGLASLQTARLNVVSIGDQNLIPPGPCRIGLSFLDARGIIINDRNGRPMSAQFDVSQGEAVFFDFSSRSIIINGRVQFRALVTLPPPPNDGSADPCANVIPTLEIFDQLTSRTLLLLHPALIRGFDPQPDPPGVPVLLQ